MTVKQLREALKAYPDSVPVVLASDSEGNEFHVLEDVNWFGEGDPKKLSPILYPGHDTINDQ